MDDYLANHNADVLAAEDWLDPDLSLDNAEDGGDGADYDSAWPAVHDETAGADEDADGDWSDPLPGDLPIPADGPEDGSDFEWDDDMGGDWVP